MSCPYFDPDELCAGSSGSRQAMLPLGDAWAGACRANPDELFRPAGIPLQSQCNLGYARGVCPRFPQQNGPDAVRFTVTGESGDAVQLYYVLERNHEPFAHGPLTYRLADEAMSPAPQGEWTTRQVRAYVWSYVRRKTEAGLR